jgi:2-methylcitrate dehydratase PrpD
MGQDRTRDKRIEPTGAALTRRNVLQRAGGILAVAALPAEAAPAVAPVSEVTLKLSAYMSEAGARALPREVTEQAKYHILDTFAAMISGSGLEPGRVAIRFARAHMGEKVATIVASDAICGAIDAAFANGILAHSDETDDYAPLGTHPGSAIVPAALAAGEQFGTDGARFVRGVTLGYDLASRVAATLGGQSFNYEGHKSIHSASGTFGAAAAAGCAAGLNAQQMRWLLDYSAQQSSGIAAWQRDTEHTEKAFVFAGMPARNGVTGALLVQIGATGVDDILSGTDNYLEAYVPKANPATLIDKLGERYEITRTTIKRWTVGGPIQAALDALEALLKRRPFGADQVKQLIVKLGPRMGTVVDNREMPDICVQHMLAVMLIDKTASFGAAHDKPRMKDPAVLKQRAKIQLALDPAIEPNIEARQAIIEVTLTDGTHLTEHVKAVRGTPENPMTGDEVIAKARDLITPVLGASTGAKLIERVLDLENVKNVRELRPLLQRA